MFVCLLFFPPSTAGRTSKPVLSGFATQRSEHQSHSATLGGHASDWGTGQETNTHTHTLAYTITSTDSRSSVYILLALIWSLSTVVTPFPVISSEERDGVSCGKWRRPNTALLKAVIGNHSLKWNFQLTASYLIHHQILLCMLVVSYENNDTAACMCFIPLIPQWLHFFFYIYQQTTLVF